MGKSNPKDLSNTYNETLKGELFHIILKFPKQFFETMG
jgi:hypothetical protein